MAGKPKIISWMITDFPRDTKDRFMGLCKMQDKDWKEVLKNIIKAYIWEHKKDV